MLELYQFDNSICSQKRPDASARVLIVIISVMLFWFTWARWGDIESDCGRELYVPMEILRGRLLYRDIWYPYGPLPPYLQALVFGIFGLHLDTAYGLGLSVTVGCALLLYEI